MCWLLRTWLWELLRLSAGAVATPSAENDVPYHHPVVRRMDVQMGNRYRFHTRADLRAALFVDDFDRGSGRFFDASFGFRGCLTAAGFAVLDPFRVDDAVDVILCALCLACTFVCL